MAMNDALSDGRAAECARLNRRLFRLRVAVIAILLALLLICSLLLYHMWKAREASYPAAYLSDAGYAAGFGLDWLDADHVFEAYGAPEHTERVETPGIDSALVRMYYPMFTLTCIEWDWGDGGQRLVRLVNVEITSPVLRFGNRSIGICSTKREVRRAYLLDRHAPQSAFEASTDDFDFPLHEGYVTDLHGSVFFSYDAQGYVTHMALVLPPR